MALHFTSSSILTSDDGIGFNKEVALETAEAKLARKASEQAASKPLYMQLAEKKELEQQEYDANTKRMFAPPRALDEEDVGYFEELANVKAKAMQARAVRESKAIEDFRTASKAASLSSDTTSRAVLAAPTKQDYIPIPKISAVRRKKESDAPILVSEKKARSGEPLEELSSVLDAGGLGSGVTSAVSEVSGLGLESSLNLLGNYGSDSSDED